MSPEEKFQSLQMVIITWSMAYPESVFPDPDHSKSGHDPTLCSAAMGRHILKRLTSIAEDLAQT